MIGSKHPGEKKYPVIPFKNQDTGVFEFKTDAPHLKFNYTENGKILSVGIIIDLNTLKN